MNILFLGKRDDFYCERAANYLKLHMPNTTIFLGKRPEELPNEIVTWNGDGIISYLSPWIVPKWLLHRATTLAINLHPGTPEYPGIGCTNFALYDEVSEFGITCHYMLPKVDTGTIITVKRFPVYPTDSVYSLTQRCHSAILDTFYWLVDHLIQHKPLPISHEQWYRKPYKKVEFDELCRLTPNMDEVEIRRRVRATTFPGYPVPYMDIHGLRFVFKENDQESDDRTSRAIPSRP